MKTYIAKWYENGITREMTIKARNYDHAVKQFPCRFNPSYIWHIEPM